MDQIEIFIGLIATIIAVGILFKKAPVPTSLLLVITGMLLSLIPDLPPVILDPTLVLDVFLPLMLYEISVHSSWRDVKKHFRPIMLLSIGHVIFITVLVAVTLHFFLPQLGWPIAFLLGAVISPPDDVAIVSIAEKIHLPRRIITVLKGEGMLNDAAALILFRFSLAAIATHQFSAMAAITDFFLVIIGETLFGLTLGFLIGELRLKVRDSKLQMLISLLTPFLAYIPAEKLGGCGVLATVVTGLVIGHRYSEHFTPEVRLVGRSMWSTIGFLVQSTLFLLVGLDLRFIIKRISVIPYDDLELYTAAVIFVVIIGRFFWVYLTSYLKSKPYPSWQYSFIVSWSGMRGGISLAAALAVPSLPMMVEGANPRDLLVFLVFSVIIATLVLQGLALPWIINALGIHIHGQREKRKDRLTELSARFAIIKTVLEWLTQHQMLAKDNPKLSHEIQIRIQEYLMLKEKIEHSIANHGENPHHDTQDEIKKAIFLSTQIIHVERAKLSQLWHEGKITHGIKNKITQQLDYRSRHLSGY